MKIDCLMGTYGRYSLACEALACFLQQSEASNATLLIYNQHPRPLYFDHPRVRVVNETGLRGSLRHIRRRMYELADPSAELIHWWDDDDLYLPWHLEDCVNNIGDGAAWKPASSWIVSEPENYRRHTQHRFEGSWIFRSEYLQRAPIDTYPAYSDHPVFLQTEEAGLVTETELGDRTSYIYRWHTGAEHVSSRYLVNVPATGSEEEQQANIETWRSRSTDVDPTGVLVPADLSPRWRRYLDATKHQVMPEDWNFNLSRLRFNPSAPGSVMGNPASDLDVIPTRSLSADFEIIGNEIILYYPREGRTIHLNPTASYIFGLCDGSRTISDIIAAIESQLPGAGPALAGDVLKTIVHLREQGILV